MSCKVNQKDETIEQNPGLSQNIGIKFGSVWKVVDSSNGLLITTSGRLNTSTLTDTINQVIFGFTLRCADYIFSLDGTVVAILHPDDTFELE